MKAIHVAMGKRMGGEKLEGYEQVPYSENYVGIGAFSMGALGFGDVGVGDFGTGGSGTGGVGNPGGESGDAAKDAATEVFPPTPVVTTPPASTLLRQCLTRPASSFVTATRRA